MNRRNFFKTAALAGAAMALPVFANNSRRQTHPNIVLLFSDDAGFSDFGFQGSSALKTPNLDRLAKQGVTCTQAYVTAAVCGPSRAGMLTGRYQQRFGFEENNVPGYMSHSGLTGDDMGLPLQEKTIADHLKALGYRSIILGKWHLGNADRYHPLKRGFDEFYGFRGGARDYYPYEQEPNQLENRLERQFGDFEEADGYLTDALANDTCRFITENQERPFFVYCAFNAVHTPLQAKPEDLAQINQFEGKRRINAAMTLALDRACGKVLDKLDELNLTENTIVIFTNDNGGPCDTNYSVNDPLSGTKATHLEGGIRVPFLMRWPGHIQANAVYEHPVSTLDLLPTFVNAAGGDAANIDGLDGVDLLPFLKNPGEKRPHQTLYWKKHVRAAIRDGDWKLIRLMDRPAELYDLKNDPSEKYDLALQHPDKVRELYKKLFEWELELERPLWQLRIEYEGWSSKRYDNYKKK